MYGTGSLASYFMATCLLPFFLLLPLLFNSVLAGMWLIDCGTEGSSTSTLTNLTWIGDGDYVREGEVHAVADTTDLDFYLTRLRAFPRKKKNCYTIGVGANTKVLVKVHFYYGNYDKLSRPPSFRLLFDDNDWDLVKTTIRKSVTKTIVYETGGRNDTNICLWRLRAEDVPFVSAIQVWTLEEGVYSDFDFTKLSLYSPWRFAFGANNTTDIRAPDDSYDRIWFSPTTDYLEISEYTMLRTNFSGIMNTSSSANNPPAKLFGTAVEAKSQNLTITTSYVVGPDQLYMSLYFSEMSILGPTTKREFNVYVDDNGPFGPISPPFGAAKQLSGVLSRITENTTITLSPTSDSTLPPIISGFESFYTWNFSRQRTDERDILALSWLQGNFSVLWNWTGDPCLPISYNWEWTKCNSDVPPRITKLYLGGYGLSGDIPDFSILDALVTIELQYNNLTGGIPEFLGNFPKLKVLNLAHNDFSSIPSSLKNSTTILVNVTGNSKLCEVGAICIYGPYGPAEAPNPPPGQSDGSKMAMFPLILLLLVTLIIM